VSEAAERLHSASVQLLRHVRKEDEASAVSAARLSALAAIARDGPLGLSELAALEHVKAPTMTRIVYGLEAAGLVSKRWRGRSVGITATPKGRRVLEEAHAARVQNLADRLRGLEPAELATVASAAELIERAFRS
jgi:DNA-binding MarR family transcriptional regulator